MAIRRLGGSTPGRRFMTTVKENISKKRNLVKGLTSVLAKTGGRDNAGHISTRHIGGRQKRLYRLVDFKRDKFDVPAQVMSIEYDPNRSCFVAQLNYKDGEKRYILAPIDLEVGATVVSGEKVEIKIGNALPLKNIPVGSVVHNIELYPGQGGAIVRSAGSSAVLMAKEGVWAHLRLPSTEVRRVNAKSLATIGTLSNPDWKNVTFGNAGRKRRMGIRPTVRGVAQNPSSHPHGGGEGRSGIGMNTPKTPWGRPAVGKTRKTKRGKHLIVTERKR